MHRSLIAAALAALIAAPAARAQPRVAVRAAPSYHVRFTGEGAAAVECFTPCELRLLPGRYTLEGAAPGHTFAVPFEMPSENVTLEPVRPSYAEIVWGSILLSFGVGALAVTAVAFVAIPLASAPDDPYNQTMAATMGVIGGLVGIGSVVGGAALVASNRGGLRITLE